MSFSRYQQQQYVKNKISWYFPKTKEVRFWSFCLGTGFGSAVHAFNLRWLACERYLFPFLTQHRKEQGVKIFWHLVGWCLPERLKLPILRCVFDAKYFPPKYQNAHWVPHSPLGKLCSFHLGWFLKAWYSLEWNEISFSKERQNLPSRAEIHPLLVDINQRLEFNFCFVWSQLF